LVHGSNERRLDALADEGLFHRPSALALSIPESISEARHLDGQLLIDAAK
jgi:hypothetical protein